MNKHRMGNSMLKFEDYIGVIKKEKIHVWNLALHELLKTRLLTKGTNINNKGDNKSKDYKGEILKKILKAS